MGELRAGAGNDSLASTMGTGQSRNSADSGVTSAPGLITGSLLWLSPAANSLCPHSNQASFISTDARSQEILKDPNAAPLSKAWWRTRPCQTTLVLASPVIFVEKIKTPALLELKCVFNSHNFLPAVLLSSHYLSGYNTLLISRYLPKLKRNVSSSLAGGNATLCSSVICFER